jgi:hypothetical protein
MKLLRTYQSAALAEFDKGVLANYGIVGEITGNGMTTIGDGLQLTAQLHIMNESDYEKAMTILRNEQLEQPPAVIAHERDRLVWFAIIVVRVMAFMLACESFMYVTYMLENMTRLTDGGNLSLSLSKGYRVRVAWDCARFFIQLFGSMAIYYFSEGLAQFVCFGLKR